MPSPFEPSPIPPDPDTKIIRNSNQNFVAAGLAADLFEYVGAEPYGTGVMFLVADPNGIVDELYRRWKAGVFPKVHPKLFIEARSYLQDEVLRHRKVTPSGGRNASH